MGKRYAAASYLSGAAAARLGDEMSGPALLLAGLAATGSTAAASWLLAGLTVSAAAGGPLFGVLLDRSARPGRLLAAALAAYASALVVVLAALGRGPVGRPVLLAAGAGLLGPALSGGWTSQLPRVVPDARLGRATALDAMTFDLASLAGPALAGTVAAWAGAADAVVGAAVLICLAAPAAWTLPGAAAPGVDGGGGDGRSRDRAAALGTEGGGGAPRERTCAAAPDASRQGGVRRERTGAAAPGTGRRGGATRGRVRAAAPGTGRRGATWGPDGTVPVRGRAAGAAVLADLAAGFRAIGRARGLARATAASAVSCVGGGILTACTPALGAAALGGAGRGALLLSCAAASALAANALLARRPHTLRPDTVVWCSALVLAGALALAATVRPWALAAAMVLAGAGEGPQLTALFAIRHRDAPARLRGQVFTTGASVKTTGYAIGAAAAGPLAGWSLPGALLTAAGFELLAALVSLVALVALAALARTDRGRPAAGPTAAPGTAARASSRESVAGSAKASPASRAGHLVRSPPSSTRSPGPGPS